MVMYMFKSMKASFVKGFTNARAAVKMTELKSFSIETAEYIKKENVTIVTEPTPATDTTTPILTMKEVMDIIEDNRVTTDKANKVGIIKRTINRIRTKYDRFTTIVTNGTIQEHTAATDAKGKTMYNVVSIVINGALITVAIYLGWYIPAVMVACIAAYDMMTDGNATA